MRVRYHKASRKEKGVLLDVLCAAAEYHRGTIGTDYDILVSRSEFNWSEDPDGDGTPDIDDDDIVTDPGELSTLAESPDSQGVLAEMIGVLESIGCPFPAEVEAPPAMNEELRERLRAVGYL